MAAAPSSSLSDSEALDNTQILEDVEDMEGVDAPPLSSGLTLVMKHMQPSLGDSNHSAIIIYGLAFPSSLETLFFDRARPLGRTRSGTCYTKSPDVHEYWISKWLGAHDMNASLMSMEEIQLQLLHLGVEVGQWGDTSPPSGYLALFTRSHVFDGMQDIDWREFSRVEKSAPAGQLKKFCDLFGIPYEPPQWVQVGYRW